MDAEQAPVVPEIGWVVTDPDGNVVDSGPLTEAQAVAWLGEFLQQHATSEEQ